MSTTNINKHIYISVIIVTFNNERHILQCISSLRKSLVAMKTSSQIIVVDNQSSDSTVDLVKKEQDVILLRQKTNLGFAKGVNRGLNWASGDTLLILNPDTKVQNDSLVNLHSCMRSSGSGIVGGLTFRSDNSIHGSYVRRPNLLTLLFDYTNLRKIFPNDGVHKRHYYQDVGVPRDQLYVDVVSGSFMMIDKKVFHEVGFFDENFFMYLEDVDYCVRALGKNVKISVCPRSKIFHEGGASSNNEDKILHSAWSGSRKYFSRKHFGFMSNIIAQPVFIIDDFLTHIWRKLKSR